MPGYDVAAWFMVVTTGKSPQAAVDRLMVNSRPVSRGPSPGAARQTKPAADGIRAGAGDAGFVKSEIVRWGKVVEAAGIAGSQ